MTPLFLHAIDLIKKQRVAAGDLKRPALLDIGANHGWFTNVRAAPHFPPCCRTVGLPHGVCSLHILSDGGVVAQLGAAAGLSVAAFEPVPEHCEKVRQSLALNNLGKDVRPLPAVCCSALLYLPAATCPLWCACGASALC